MHTRILASTRPHGALLSVVALAPWAALPASAHAVVNAPAECPVTSAADAITARALVGRQVAITVADLRGATAGSPAAWRLHEETERLEAESRVLDQLQAAFAAKEGATPGSPAQWRAQESSDQLCELLTEDSVVAH